MQHPITDLMRSAGAVVLKSLPWTGQRADAGDVASRVYRAMESQRIADELDERDRALDRRRAANTPWDAPRARLVC